MATQTITYTNKADLYTDSSIADINKVKASDMNEIKSVVNNNANVLNAMWPVGSIFINTTGVNPSEFIGGTWESYGNGRVLVGQNTSDTDFDTLGETGGNKALQKHSHEGIFWSDNNGVGLTTYGSAAYRLSFTQAACSNAFHTGVAGTGAEPTATNGNLQPYIVVSMWVRTA